MFKLRGKSALFWIRSIGASLTILINQIHCNQQARSQKRLPDKVITLDIVF